jgi:AcrR family transcriptional regulator
MANSSLRERKRLDARVAAIDAAFDLFARHGYNQVTVAEICTAANIGRRTFFRYFASKDDVLAEPAREMTSRVAESIAAAPASSSDGRVLRAALAQAATYALQNRDRYRELSHAMRTGAGIDRAPLARLSEQEAGIAELLRTRPGRHPAPWRTRLLVARAIAAFRVWLDSLVDGSVEDLPRHFDELFDLDPMLS